MRFQCPHCAENDVKGFSKFMSHEASPAVCNSCRKFSCEPPGVRNYYNFISGIGLPLALAVGIFVQFWWLILVWVTFVVIFPFYALFALPLVPVHELTVKKAKWQMHVALIIIFIFLILAGISG